MPIPAGLHFDPIELASKVDPSIPKKYEMPYKGQTFIQLHQGGTHIVVGTCVGLDLHMDRAGTVMAWRASIESKFTTASGITNGSTWRDASEWHPAPLTQQESVTDVRDALNALAERVRLLEEQDELTNTLNQISDKIEPLLALPDIANELSLLHPRLAALESLLHPRVVVTPEPEPEPEAKQMPMFPPPATAEPTPRIRFKK